MRAPILATSERPITEERAADLARGWLTATVDRSAGPGACWPWQGVRTAGGYGRVNVGISFMAHRLVWINHHGAPVPAGQYVCHSCDNPVCCNPAHLWIGTPADNMRDARIKGRLRGNMKPCGTVAAARRHQRAGEPLCAACAEAWRGHQRKMYQNRKGTR